MWFFDFRLWLRQQREAKFRSQLDFVQRQISTITRENEQLRQIATQCACESAGHPDETRDQRMAGRSDQILDNSKLIARYAAEEKRLKWKLGIATA